jgi:hypothetical protein
MSKYLKIKQQFKQQLKTFAEILDGYVSAKDRQWTVKGFIDVFQNIYIISADTKIVSKILEIHLFPEILKFAEKNGYRMFLRIIKIIILIFHLCLLTILR